MAEGTPPTTRTGSIRRRQALFAAVLVAATAGVLTAVGYHFFRAELRSASEDSLASDAHLRRELLDAYIDQQIERINLVASRTNLRALLGQHLAGVGEQQEAELLAEVKRILEDALASAPGFLVLSIIDPEGDLLVSTGGKDQRRDLRGEPVFEKGREETTFGRPGWSPSGLHALAAGPARDEAGQLLGVVMARLILDPIMEKVLGSPDDSVSVRLGVTENGRVVELLGHSAPVPLDDDKAMQAAFEGKTGVILTTDPQGSSGLAAYEPVDHNDWVLVAFKPESEAFKAIAELRSWVLLAVVIVIIVAIYTSYWWDRQLIRPIQGLAETAARLRSGDLGARASAERNDEIGRLGEAFNDMAAQLQQDQARLERQVAERTAELEAARDAAQAADRAKSEFLAIASHDLRNPLARVLGSMRLLASKIPKGATMTDEGAEMVESAEHGARVMQQIVEDYLELEAIRSRAMPLVLSPVDFNELASRAVADMRALAEERRMTLKLELADDAQPVLADGRRIEQVLQNLLDNALKYAGESNTVTVRTRIDGDGLRVEVADTGPGLPEDQLATLFEREVVRLRPAGEGEKSTHMGLSICRQIIELHGGEIGVHNDPAGGACFWFRLPAVPDPSPPRPGTAPPAGLKKHTPGRL